MLLPGSFPAQQLPCAASVENQKLLGLQGFHHPTDENEITQNTAMSIIYDYLHFCLI
jgi:hypothetical protein